MHLVEKVEIGASAEARARGLELSVTPPDDDVEVERDKQLLGDAVVSLVNTGQRYAVYRGALTGSSTVAEVEAAFAAPITAGLLSTLTTLQLPASGSVSRRWTSTPARSAR